MDLTPWPLADMVCDEKLVLIFLSFAAYKFFAAYKILRWSELFLQVVNKFSGPSKYLLKVGIALADFSHRDDNKLG